MLGKDKNALNCDVKTKVCTSPQAASHTDESSVKVAGDMHVIYYTDPICSSCWGIEPQLRKLKLKYGHGLRIEYRMGGLLPDWSYNSGGISKPSDVASHWDEASRHYQMPIDGDVWLEDPLDSSYPPSQAYKAAEIQDTHKAQIFMRRIREMVFLEKKNITKWEHLSKAATYAGLDVEKMKKDAVGVAVALFQEDMKLGGQLGVRGFPTLFFVNDKVGVEKVYGAQGYSKFEAAINKQAPHLEAQSYGTSWEDMFRYYPTWTLREYSEVASLAYEESQRLLDALVKEGKLERFDTKNGSIWRRR